MFSARHVMFASLACCLLPAAFAQDAAHVWQKSYAISQKPTLTLEASDSNLDVHSCGECRSVHIQVNSGRNLDDYRLEERQSGDQIWFSLKEKTRVGFHIFWGNAGRLPQIIVETPASLTLNAHTADGNLVLRDLRGDLQVRTGDGNADISNVEGALQLNSGDGNVQIRNTSGSLQARTSDGHMTVEGRFTSVQIHTSDGNLDVALMDGSQLNSASRIDSSDGAVKVRIPRTLAADLDISTGDGHIDCSLPLVLDHYDSGKRHVHGRLNGGGAPLTIQTSDGNITIAQI